MTSFTDDQILENFPFDAPREGQLECIRFILDSFFNRNIKYVILEGPVGSGKSAVGITVAKFFESSYYLTIQKILQTQIINDFGSGETVDLKGRSAYNCQFYERFGADAVSRKGMFQKELDTYLAAPPTCNEGYCRKKYKSRRCPLCFPVNIDNGLFEYYSNSYCPYYKQISRAMVSKVAVMNYNSYLYQSAIAKRFDQRELLVIDECHQTEPQLLDFISITISDKILKKFGYILEEYDMPQEYYVSFMENDVLAKIQAIAEVAADDNDIDTADEYESLSRKLASFFASIENEEEWVAEFKNAEGHKDYRTVTLKPVYVHSKSHELMFNGGKKILLMSATILDIEIFCSSLGIPRNQVAAYRMKNRFPVANRPIVINTAAKIVGGPAKMHEWSPKLVAKTDEILDKYTHSRGIVHTHNFAIAELLMKKSRHNKRFLFQKKFATKDDMLRKHADSDDTIIVAPAMHEGLDLHGDLSRVQLICKIPWPNFVDNKQLARRLELDRRYYVWLCALKLIQSTGRSIRSETDWAHTYVLDEGFHAFMQQAAFMIPSWFKDAVEYGKKHKTEIMNFSANII